MAWVPIVPNLLKLATANTEPDTSQLRVRSSVLLQWISSDGLSPVTAGVAGSAPVSRSVWKFVEGFLEGISRLLGSGGGRKNVPICHCPCKKWELVGMNVEWHNGKCISSTVSSAPSRTLEFVVYHSVVVVVVALTLTRNVSPDID